MNTDTISAMYQELGVDKDVLDFGTAVGMVYRLYCRNTQCRKRRTACLEYNS